MFETEVFRQLNMIKANINDHKTTVAKREITRLIKENPDDFQKFMENPSLEDWIKHTMKDCQEASQERNLEDMTDIEIIKKGYSEWLTHYERNNNIPNKECENIIVKIINYYINRYYIIEQVLKVEDTESFEAFKNMLKNYVRKYWAEKIEEYLESESFNSMSYFGKRKKRKEILLLLEKVGKYEMKPELIKEAIK